MPYFLSREIFIFFKGGNKYHCEKPIALSSNRKKVEKTNYPLNLRHIYFRLNRFFSL